MFIYGVPGEHTEYIVLSGTGVKPDNAILMSNARPDRSLGTYVAHVNGEWVLPQLTTDEIYNERQNRYRKYVDPMILESILKDHMGLSVSAKSLLDAAEAKRLEIQTELPISTDQQ